ARLEAAISGRASEDGDGGARAGRPPGQAAMDGGLVNLRRWLRYRAALKRRKARHANPMLRLLAAMRRESRVSPPPSTSTPGFRCGYVMLQLAKERRDAGFPPR
ncbi:hypothetical protein, partial [Variovorax sp. WDL1]|uniref:hypothetical protein n=1 Tax=Variovorax sp. WDL1 TaxID=207745 RepID=UPI001E448DBF